jgi:peroxiredoxin
MKTIAAIVSLLLAPSTAFSEQTSPPDTAVESVNASKSIAAPGERAPNVTVADIHGAPQTLHSLLASDPALVIFYRGGWCPYCNRHLKELQTIEKQLTHLGFRIIAISPDRPSELKKTLRTHNLSYDLYSDSAMTAARVFGLAFTVKQSTVSAYRLAGINLKRASGLDHHMLPIPAAFLVDHDGYIRYSYSNPDYKVRADPKQLLQAARQIAGAHDGAE